MAKSMLNWGEMMQHFILETSH